LYNDNKIIGGMFGLPETVESKVGIGLKQWKFLDNSNIFLASARSGIMILIDLLKPPIVWMPSYLCSSMLKAVDQSKAKMKFYEVDYDLQISFLNWIKQIQAGDLVVLIDYFGFPLSPKIAGLVKERGGYVLEDASQALLSEQVGRYSDFVLFSPRKFIGVPDGGILASHCNVNFDSVKLKPAPTSWWLKMLEAAISRREYDHFGCERKWHQLFQECESANSPGYFAMSDLSQKLLFNAFDYAKIAKRRIENYAVLLNDLKDIALFPLLPDDIVPLGFLVRHPDRDTIRQNLFKEHIYPPVHWPIEGLVSKEFYGSHLLADEIMTLPCDQRYDVEAMNRIVFCIQKSLKNN